MESLVCANDAACESMMNNRSKWNVFFNIVIYFFFSDCLLFSVDQLLFNLNLFADFAESPFAPLIVEYRFVKLFLSKIGPKDIRKI